MVIIVNFVTICLAERFNDLFWFLSWTAFGPDGYWRCSGQVSVHRSDSICLSISIEQGTSQLYKDFMLHPEIWWGEADLFEKNIGLTFDVVIHRTIKLISILNGHREQKIFISPAIFLASVSLVLVYYCCCFLWVLYVEWYIVLCVVCQQAWSLACSDWWWLGKGGGVELPLPRLQGCLKRGHSITLTAYLINKIKHLNARLYWTQKLKLNILSKLWLMSA